MFSNQRQRIFNDFLTCNTFYIKIKTKLKIIIKNIH